MATETIASGDPVVRTCLVQGWALVAFFMALGLVLESFFVVKLPFYFDHGIRRELWTLAHAHGGLLGLLVVLYGLSLHRLMVPGRRRLAASRLVRAGAVLVPGGFLLGGVGATEGDPSLFIVLAPIGAVSLLLAVGMLLRGPRPVESAG